MKIQQKSSDFGLGDLDAVGNMQEEQERELAPDMEHELEIDRPGKLLPKTHRLHPNVESFAMTGFVAQNSKAFLPAFQTLAKFSVAELFPMEHIPSSLLATKDFARSLKPDEKCSCLDPYWRPVQWILTQHVQILRAMSKI